VTSVVVVLAVLSTLTLLSLALIVAWTAVRRLDDAAAPVARAAAIEHSSTRRGLDDATDRLRDAVDHRRPR
jgi:Flp pilus assembly protein TadG